MSETGRNPIDFPMALLAELTHRCPLQCPYCSNPVELEQAGRELDTGTWLRVIEEAAELGALQIHFSGGEPTVRKDLEEMVARARDVGLYSNLITAGVLLDEDRVGRLVDSGLDHVQLSFQDSEATGAERIGGYPDAQKKKLRFAGWVRAAGLPLTLNLVVHRQNLDHLPQLIELAVELGAQRAEIAHVQYYGWAFRNRAALMPTREQLERATATVEEARERLKGRLVLDYVVPDYYARRPKSCMGGWGRRFLNVSPAGKVLPCHAAETITGLRFDSVTERSLADIWQHSEAFEIYRGTDWMPEPCRSCERREIDWGGCRCQAFAITGEAGATDPACALSPFHDQLVALAEADSGADCRDFVYRRFANVVRRNTPMPAK
ncbi:pyrroloquinoline quinone biosynthesis protein E [Tistlia consotensis]|uniref:PqqA peptide cyclase n=1 Tax=Tistlia consotensis USBA 355 TaxID=560819 RepID=A0A1Y6CPX5_9PROT|nr:pyrroloquinoline quinone biosynthesis protein PqqE [Tistlia consotensis]SMF80332.1 pyrroloquinoline quinone biosynthesis protein E [Tistlia consotensis USBA 355]SNR62534.1 pyrroloquinoline quinone biosynthesis protein E [Tistlia consotensis]